MGPGDFTLTYTIDDDGVWLECPVEGCDYRVLLGHWPTVAVAGHAAAAHLLAAHPYPTPPPPTRREPKMSRRGGQQAKAAKAEAERSRQVWTAKRDQAKDQTSKNTYQRGVDRANRAIADAQRTINRHAR
jgi:hypothetical protein